MKLEQEPIDLIEVAVGIKPLIVREALRGRNTSRLFKRMLRARVQHGMSDFDWYWLTLNLASLPAQPSRSLMMVKTEIPLATL